MRPTSGTASMGSLQPTTKTRPHATARIDDILDLTRMVDITASDTLKFSLW